MYTHNLTVKDPPNVTLSLKTSLGSTTVLGGGYSPYSLFVSGESGVWFDPSDLTTMFQDSVGTIPVTAPGQPVGLILDKSKGLQLGLELVTNGSFTSDTSWTKGSGWTISGGSANKSAGSATSLYQPVAVSAGKTYRISFTATRSAGFFTPAFTNLGVINAVGVTITASGTYVQYILAPAGATHLIFYADAAFSGSLDNVSVKEIQGNHASQSTSSSRPIYGVVLNGSNTLHYLDFDGVDDFLVTPSITPNVDKVQVYTGFRKLSDATLGVVAEFSTTSVNSGTFAVFAPNSIPNGFGFRSRGTSVAELFVTSPAAPATVILTGLGDISGDNATLRVNGTQATQSTADQGTGNFLPYPIYIGRRGGTSLPFKGNLYSLVVRFGANLSTNLTASTESWVNQKTGAY